MKGLVVTKDNKLYLEENLEFSQLKDVFGRMEERKC